jgi:integrase
MSTVECPSCRNERIWKDGIRHTRNGGVQRYLCRECGYRFSETSWNGSDDPEYIQRVHREPLNTHPRLLSNRQICVTQPTGMKNLVEVESRIEKRVAGATKLDSATVKGKIVEFLWYLKRENYAESTIGRYVKEIKLLIKRGANILDPEDVKETIAKQKWCDNRRAQVYWVYDAFVRMLRISWDMPRIRTQQKIGFCPTEKTVNQAIAGLGKKISIAIQLVKETDIRSGEADNMKWDQINFENGTITIIPEKGSNPTVKKVSRDLLGRIGSLPKVSEKIFGEHGYDAMRTNLAQQRKVLAKKLGNPELLRLTFVSIRHFYGTKLYHQFRDLMTVQKLMGHKRFTSTLQYIDYEKAIYGDYREDEWICKTAQSPEEAKDLIEAGFRYEDTIEDIHLYKKRKL